MNDSDFPKNAEHVAAMLEGDAGSNEVGDGPKFPVSLRLPIFDVAWVDALAARIGKSRNWTFHLIVDVAQQEITGRLSTEAGQQLHAEFQNRALAMVEAHEKGAA